MWMWNLDGRHAGYIARRQAHEALIHRIDAELTAGRRTPVDAALGTDGIDEVLSVMHGPAVVGNGAAGGPCRARPDIGHWGQVGHPGRSVPRHRPRVGQELLRAGHPGPRRRGSSRLRPDGDSGRVWTPRCGTGHPYGISTSAVTDRPSGRWRISSPEESTEAVRSLSGGSATRRASARRSRDDVGAASRPTRRLLRRCRLLQRDPRQQPPAPPWHCQPSQLH